MKLVRSLLTSVAFTAAMMSASFSFAQCCGGAATTQWVQLPRMQVVDVATQS